jgi:hypothetical protein
LAAEGFFLFLFGLNTPFVCAGKFSHNLKGFGGLGGKRKKIL